MGFMAEWRRSAIDNYNELVKLKESRFKVAIGEVEAGNYFKEFNPEAASDILYIINIYVPVLAYVNCKLYGENKANIQDLKPLSDARIEIIEMFNNMQYIPSFIKELSDCNNSVDVKSRIDKYDLNEDDEVIAERYLKVYKAGELLTKSREIYEKGVLDLYSTIKRDHDDLDCHNKEIINNKTVLDIIDVQKIMQKK